MVVIKKLDALSVAKIQGIFGAILGLIIGFFFLITASIMQVAIENKMSSFTSTDGGSPFAPVVVGSAPIFNIGWIGIIILPIIYGLIFFVIGLVFSWLYNLIAKIVGGIEMELENENSQPKTTNMQQQVQK